MIAFYKHGCEKNLVSFVCFAVCAHLFKYVFASVCVCESEVSACECVCVRACMACEQQEKRKRERLRRHPAEVEKYYGKQGIKKQDK